MADTTLTTDLRSVGVIGPPGAIRDPGRFDEAAMLAMLGDNSGNLVFQHAATCLLENPRAHISKSEMSYNDAYGLDVDVFVFPAANHLRTDADWESLALYLRSLKKPLVVLGLGAQAPALGMERETIADLKAHPTLSTFVDVLRERAAFISVRGGFTETVCHELGLKEVEALGCPSAMINPDPALGTHIALGFEHARSRYPDIRPGLAAAAPFTVKDDPALLALERKLFDWVVRGGGAYVQQSGGETVLRVCSHLYDSASEEDWRYMRYVLAPETNLQVFRAFMGAHAHLFVSAPAWFRALSACDAVIGTRIHGVMAALAGGTPGALIAHDSRTGELAETMRLPRIPLAAVEAAPTFAEALAAVEFDAIAFDTWRQRTAGRYVDTFRRLGLTPSRALTGLAGAA